MYPRQKISILTALFLSASSGSACVAVSPVELFHQSPASISNPAPNVVQIDFGRVAFGNLQLTPPPNATGTIKVHFGEKFIDGRIDTKPPGTVRYNVASAELKGNTPLIVAPPADARNTEQVSDKHPPAVLTPQEWGVVVPFRWVEIEGWPGELKPDQIVRRAAFAKNWVDDAASFECSDEILNRIWALCRYSIKATTFAGVYVDGDRERIPYEADAYLNQLSHYATDSDVVMARDTFDWLMKHGTWPTEWAPHMVFMAHAEWMHTGDRQWLEPRYESLKAKTLLDRAGADGLITSNAQHRSKSDIVDWPKGERDGYVFTAVNTVVNAFHLAAMKRMADLARGLGKETDAAEFDSRVRKTLVAFQSKLFDDDSGLYVDGIGTEHASLHANLFPLAFGLVPDEKRQPVVDWLKTRDMDCSVYASQYFLEGLFQYGADKKAIELMTAPTDRSWRHMIESGTTITWEAWDMKYKPNQDWNHAWGAAPANLLPRFVLGAEPIVAGWKRALIRPCPGGLENARGSIPTPHGPITIGWENNATFKISITLPEGIRAKVELPAAKGTAGVIVNGKSVQADLRGDHWILTEDIARAAEVEVR